MLVERLKVSQPAREIGVVWTAVTNATLVIHYRSLIRLSIDSRWKLCVP